MSKEQPHPLALLLPTATCRCLQSPGCDIAPGPCFTSVCEQSLICVPFLLLASEEKKVMFWRKQEYVTVPYSDYIERSMRLYIFRVGNKNWHIPDLLCQYILSSPWAAWLIETRKGP